MLRTNDTLGQSLDGEALGQLVSMLADYNCSVAIRDLRLRACFEHHEQTVLAISQAEQLGWAAEADGPHNLVFRNVACAA